jgi:hypothetical protein
VIQSNSKRSVKCPSYSKRRRRRKTKALSRYPPAAASVLMLGDSAGHTPSKIDFYLNIK